MQYKNTTSYNIEFYVVVLGFWNDEKVEKRDGIIE